MTSYEFELAAKDAVRKELLEKFKVEAMTAELNVVWYAHVLGFKKCTIWGKPMGELYAEVTYDRDAKEMYVDIYAKTSNTVYHVV